MLLLLPIAFGAGLVTVLTPCILPVLPIVLAGGGSGGRRRPYAIVAGLVTTFTLFTLAAASILSALHLSGTTLTRIAVVLLLVLAVTLVVPGIGELLKRPLAFLTRRRGGDLGGGFVLGASLGLVFVPCAGPVFGAVSGLAGLHRVGASAVAVTLAYALGAALPMLAIAHGSRRVVGRFRAHAHTIRVALGVVMAVAALAIFEGWETSLQTSIPGYASSLQSWIEGNGTAKRELAKLRGTRGHAEAAVSLNDFGPAAGFVDISHWLNTPGDRELSLPALRGKVVLVDFWTYSCINCLRTLSHLEAWDARYRKAGLVILGVHTPEFAFEHDLGNVRSAVKRLGIRYPVALDNAYATWSAYQNQYWPAEYLIDAHGRLRGAHFGEGRYAETEHEIRWLLAQRTKQLPPATGLPDRSPTGLVTPETYLGYAHQLPSYVGSRIRPDRFTRYVPAAEVPQSGVTYGGLWNVGAERMVSGLGATIRLNYHARDVYIVLGGQGRVETLVDGKLAGTIRVDGYRLYTAVAGGTTIRSGLLELRFPPGIAAYSFTFG
jgi:cytochrome c biogenesis protein CcdA/thiol-disulfide isomerase/thioredoxin